MKEFLWKKRLCNIVTRRKYRNKSANFCALQKNKEHEKNIYQCKKNIKFTFNLNADVFIVFKDVQEEVNALRIQEEVERQWKSKEREAALETVKNEMMLKMSREEQIKEKQILLALEIKRDREQLEKFAAIQSQAINNHMMEKNKKRQEAIYYRNEILKQVHYY